MTIFRRREAALEDEIVRFKKTICPPGDKNRSPFLTYVGGGSTNMAVPDSTTFLGWAGKTIPGSMAEICQAIDAYKTQPTVDGLYIISKECKDWKKGNTSMLFSSTTEMRKSNSVDRLVGEVTGDLNAVMPGLGDALQGYERKKSTAGVLGGKFTSLGRGYSNERAGYLASGKQMAPFSGTKVHTMVGNDAKFHKLDVKEFERIATDPQLLAHHFGRQPIVRMYFLNKIQRLKLLVKLDSSDPAGPRWKDISGNPMHTEIQGRDFLGEENVCQMWAMDRYGNLFVDYDNAGHGKYVLNTQKSPASAAIKSRGQTNHSSFCAGREIVCAGNVFFWKGQLLHIDNGSGHYAPKRDALYRAVSLLWTEGAKQKYIRVGVIGGPNVDTKLYTIDSFMRHGAADWPDQNWKADQNAIYAKCPGFHQ